MVIDSILTSIKQLLGVAEEDTNFDMEIIIYINGELMVLNQLGVGVQGYVVIDASNTWSEFLGGRTDLELIKTNVYLKVRLVFDPPQNSFLVEAIKNKIVESDWRIEFNHIPE